MLCDNGTQYRSREFLGLLEKYQVPSNPTERVNRVLKTMLASYLEDNHRAWADKLSEIACTVRAAKHDTIGMTPYFAIIGREMVINGRFYVDAIVESLKVVRRLRIKRTP